MGRGTQGLATLKPGDTLDMVGPLGQGFTIDPKWKNIVVLGRGVGLATMAPISQTAGEMGVRVTAILSARSWELALAADLRKRRHRDQGAGHRRDQSQSRTSKRCCFG